MRVKNLVVAGLAAGSTLLALGNVVAAPAATPLPAARIAIDPLVEQVQWGGYGYCTSARYRCANRYGWGTWRYRQCVGGRGCSSDGGWGDGRPYSFCRDLRRRCASQYGWGSSAYHRCVNDRGCGRI